MLSKEDLSIGNQFSFSSQGSNESKGIHGEIVHFGSSKCGKFPWWPEEDEEEEEEKAMQHHAKYKDKQHGFDHYIPRVEEIAKHRREMLEMVEDLPEFDYELSLKDMVELPAKVEKESREREVWMDKYISLEKEKKKRNKNNNNKKKKKKKKKNDKSGEFLLKMLLPLNLGGKKKSSLGSPCYSSKVSPRPVGIRTVDKVNVDDKDHESRKMRGCYWFFENKGKTISVVEGKY